MNIKKGKSRLLLVMLFAGFALVTNAFAGIDQAAVDKCKSCHEDTVNGFLAGAHHGKVWSKGYADKKYSCESCHGNADKHIAAGGSKETIIRFGKDSKTPAEEQAKQCLACHKTNPSLAMWNMGAHKSNDVACASCHSIHKGEKKISSETCFSCHRTFKAQMQKLSHHPVIEGKVSCSDCHNPHGATAHGMIKADNVNQLCYKCHQDKRGPFMREHDPVEENCSTCHTVHGSNHASLLVKPVPMLCKDCHEGPHGGVNAATKFVGRACLNCHNRIHGSNAPGGEFFTR